MYHGVSLWHLVSWDLWRKTAYLFLDPNCSYAVEELERTEDLALYQHARSKRGHGPIPRYWWRLHDPTLNLAHEVAVVIAHVWLDIVQELCHFIVRRFDGLVYADSDVTG